MLPDTLAEMLDEQEDRLGVSAHDALLEIMAAFRLEEQEYTAARNRARAAQWEAKQQEGKVNAERRGAGSTTLGTLIVQIAGDNSPLQRSLKASTQLTAQFKQQINAARNDFAQSAIRLREDVFSGALSPAQFKKQGILAAKEYNTAILTQIAELRSNGQLTTRLHASLVQELQDVGLASGKSFLKGFGDAMSSAGQTLRGIGTKLTLGATLPLVGEGVASFKAASDAAEEANAFQVTFGPLAANVQRQLDAMHRTIPVTNTDLQKLAGGFGALLLPMGFTGQKASEMSTRLVKLAGDIQSLRNIPFNEVVQRLTSGLVGETEAVRRLGANIGDVALKQEALRLGFGGNTAALSAQQKALAVYNILLRDTALATGDAENTMNSAANTIRFAKRNFDELQVVIGNRLIPVITPLVQRLADFLDKMKGTSTETITFYLKLGAIVAVSGPVITALGGIASAIGAVARAAGAASTAVSNAGGLSASVKGLASALTSPGGLVAAIGLIVVGLAAWAVHLDNVKNNMDALKSSAREMTRDQLSAEIQKRSAAIGTLQQQQVAAPIVLADQTNVAAGAHGAISDARPTKTKGQLSDEITAAKRELGVYIAQWAELTAGETRANDVAAKQSALWAQLQKQFEDAANAAKGGSTAKTIGDTIANMIELKKGATEFHNTAQALAIDKLLGAQLAAVDRALAGTGGKLDATSLKLARLRRELLESSVTAQILSGEFVDERTRKLPGVGVTPRDIGIPETGIRAGAALSFGLPPSFKLQNGQTVNTNRVTAPDVAAGPSIGEARLNVALSVARDGLSAFGGALKNAASSGFFAALSSIAGQMNPFAAVISAISEAAKPLAPIMAKIGQIVADTLGPVFEAFAPVLEELLPLIRAVMQVIAPILKALAPLFAAFIPILEAIFPIFKLVAIAATYIGQVFAIAASVVTRAVGNIVIGFGTIIKALAIAVDKLPFVSAKGAINAAQGIIDFGKGLLAASDDFKKTADEMAQAREDINKVTIDKTSDSLDGLADAADTAAAAMLNVPSVFRYNLRVAEQWTPEDWNPDGGTALPRNPSPQTPVGQPGGSTSAPGGITIHGDVNINTSGDGEETWDNMKEEAARRALATSGQSTRWQEAF